MHEQASQKTDREIPMSWPESLLDLCVVLDQQMHASYCIQAVVTATTRENPSLLTSLPVPCIRSRQVHSPAGLHCWVAPVSPETRSRQIHSCSGPPHAQ